MLKYSWYQQDFPLQYPQSSYNYKQATRYGSIQSLPFTVKSNSWLCISFSITVVFPYSISVYITEPKISPLSKSLYPSTYAITEKFVNVPISKV